jgi:hypothetical protein
MDMRHLRLIAAACSVALLLMPAAAGARTQSPPPHLAHPNVTGRRLVVHFFVLLQRQDHAGLERFLSPSFQVQRADGSSSEKTAYLAKLSIIERFYLSNLAATQAGPVLIVRYLARVTGLVNGKPYTPGPAPRLSVFVWNGARWQLAAHANFNPLTG